MDIINDKLDEGLFAPNCDKQMQEIHRIEHEFRTGRLGGGEYLRLRGQAFAAWRNCLDGKK